ncbi:MAG: rhomboid family intramembrane serine protease, partial [Polyangiaceae bacterium]|nr:rhomboid family intramembrane serine protease [Polyangiaceae bacterium]
SAATIALSSFDAPGFLGILQRLISAQPRGVPYITTTLGASGAVFGMMGLVLGWLLRRRDSRWKTFAMEAVLFSVLFGFAVNASPRSTIVINNAAHIGGLLAGIVFGFVYAGGRRWAPPWLVNGGAAFCVLACIGSLILAQLSPRWRMVDQTLTSLPEGLPSDSTVTAPNR